MTAVRALSFDLFDTLVDLHFSRLPTAELAGRTIPSTLTIQHRVLAERGHDVALEKWVSVLRESDRELRASHLDQGIELPTILRFTRAVEDLGLEDEELPSLLTDTHMGTIASVAETPPHHASVLANLSKRFPLGLCSNFSHTETALSILSGAKLQSYFTGLTVSEAVGIRKPRAEIFEHALAAMDATPEETVHVGDTLGADIGGAAALGMRTVWIDRRVRDKQKAIEEYDGPPPTWTVSDLSELEALF